MKQKLSAVILKMMVIIIFFTIAILILNRYSNKETTINLGQVVYQITYTNISIGNYEKYSFDVDSDYQIKVNVTSTGSYVEATETKKTYGIELSENNKKYLKNILDNLTEYKDETEGKCFEITDKKTSESYYICIGSEEYTMLRNILILQKEISQDIME